MGTVMRLNRKGKQTKFWHEQIIVVDNEFLQKEEPTKIKLDYIYNLGINALEVYHNGERLANNITYSEVDSCTININKTIGLGDEIYIRIWQQDLCCTGGGYGDLSKLEALEREIIDSRNYVDISYPTLGDRLDEIQNSIEQLKNIAGNINVKQPLMYKVFIEYETDNEGNITREKMSGDFNYIKKYVHDSNGHLITEVGEYAGKAYYLYYERDENGYLIREHGSRLLIVPSLPFYKLKLIVENVDTRYTNDMFGNVLIKEMNDFQSITIRYQYDNNGNLQKERASLFDTIYEIEYERNSKGFVMCKYGHFLTPILTDCGIVYAPHYKESQFTVDRFGNIIETVITGDFSYFKEYFYNENDLVTEEIIRSVDNVRTRGFRYSIRNYIDSEEGYRVVEYPDLVYVYHVLYGQFCRGLMFSYPELQANEVTFEYDSNGNKTKEVYGGFVKEFVYDELGVLVKELQKYRGLVRVKEYCYEDGKLMKAQTKYDKLPIL